MPAIVAVAKILQRKQNSDQKEMNKQINKNMAFAGYLPCRYIHINGFGTFDRWQ